MTVFHAKAKPPQPELWIATHRLARPAKSAFYSKLEQTLDAFGFAGKVRRLCAPAYDQSGMGRPGIDPVVYLKMMMIGFFENLTSERAIAARCTTAKASNSSNPKGAFTPWATSLAMGSLTNKTLTPGSRAGTSASAKTFSRSRTSAASQG